MKRYISIITAAVILITFISFTGCSPPENSEPQSADEAGSDISSGKTVIFCTYNAEGEKAAPPEAEVNEYLESLGCDFEIGFLPIGYIGNGIEKLIEEGTQPDILYSVCLDFEDRDMTVYNKLFYDGMYLCLDGYLYNTEAGKKLYEAFPEKHWNELKIDGSIYGIDGSFSTLSANFGYLYDKALTEKYGYDITQSPLEQTDKLREISDGEGIVPFLLLDNFFLASGYTDSRRLASGVVFDEESGRAISLLEDKEFSENVRIAYTLSQQGLADGDDRASHFATGFFSPVNMKNGEPFEYQRRTVLPQMKNSPKTQSPVSAVGIYKNSREPDKAFELLSLIMTDPYLNNLITYGAEGKSCRIDENGYVTERWSREGTTVCQFINRYIALPNSMERFMEISAEQYAETMEAAEERPAAAGFAVDTDPIYGECSAVDKLLREMSSEIISPEAGLSFEGFVEKYSSKLDEAGLGTAIDEVNRQYEAFKEKNY